MKVIERGKKCRVTCPGCNSVLEYEGSDLRWTHTEEDMYYIVCPVCGESIWIKATAETDDMYHKAHSYD